MKKRRNSRIVAALVFLASIYAQAQESASDTLYFSLQESMTFAMEHNLNAENARLDVDAADQRVWETAAIGLPQVNGSLNYNYNINLPTTLIPDFVGDPNDKIEVQFGTRHNASTGITGTQLVFSGEYIVGLQAAKIFKQFTEQNRLRAEQDVRSLVMQTYYLVLLGESTLEALQGNRDNVRATFEETLELYRAGFAEEIEADQLEVAKINLENAVLSMERQIMASRNLLKYQMGVDRQIPVVLTDSLPALVQTVDVDEVLTDTFSLDYNLDYRILQEQERLALMDMKRKKTEYLPTINAFYNLDFSAQRDEFNFGDSNEDWYRASLVGLSLNLPIFSSGNRRSGVAQKRIALEQARNNREYAGEGLQVQYLQARYDFSNALEKYRSDQKNLEISRKVVRVTKTKFDEGMASSLELTQVNDQYLDALGSYTNSMVELLNAKITLDILLNKI